MTGRGQFVVGLVVLTCAGCSSEPYSVALVSGRLTLNGSPLPNATVTFQPIGSLQKDPGPGSTGRTDADGRYALRIVAVGGGRQGAVVGPHRVTITTQSGASSQPTPDDQAPPPEILPTKYHSESKMRFEVPPEGTDRADFALTKP
jgi:hypothetical protein